MTGLTGIYIGDGVYVEYDEPLTQWWLRAQQAEGVHEVALGPGEIYSLIGAVVRTSPGIATSLYVALDEATA